MLDLKTKNDAGELKHDCLLSFNMLAETGDSGRIGKTESYEMEYVELLNIARNRWLPVPKSVPSRFFRSRIVGGQREVYGQIRGNFIDDP